MTPQLSSRRKQLDEEREAIRTDFLEDVDPRRAWSRLCGVMDGLVVELARQHLEETECAIVATAGYGRKELYPYSDLDLLLLLEKPVQGAAEKALVRFLQGLWDLGLVLGQQVWSRRELQELEPAQAEFATALLESRFLWGSGELKAWLEKEFLPGFAERHRDALSAAIVDWTRQRHRRFEETVYQLEPDLKDAPGGLRDFHASQLLAALHGEPPSLGHRDIEAAHRFVGSLRIMVHCLSRRPRNVLSHRLQEQIAPLLGFGGRPRSAVESMMKEYFLHARAIAERCRAFLTSERGVCADELRLEDVDTPHNMEEALGIVRRSLEEGRPIGNEVSGKLTGALLEISETVSYPRLAPAVVQLFQPRPGLYKALSLMERIGLLELLFPEFGTVRARVIRDFYHKYTVDEHTLLAIRAVEELSSPRMDGEAPPDARFCDLLSEVERPEILTLALLLHDVGKSRAGKHVESSAQMAAKAFRRFRFDPELIDSAIFLIRNHLAMSSVMFRRNLEDDQVIGRFADLVATTQQLRLLCLLTYADIKAVAPGTLNQWKRDRLWQLYVASYNKLTRDFGEETISAEDVSGRLVETLPQDLDRDGFESFLEGFPVRYLTTTPPHEIFQHYRLGLRLREQGKPQIRLEKRRTHWELCVVTADRYRLFARIVGLLSSFDMNILRGYGFHNQRGVILDFFQFSDTNRVFELNPGEPKRMEELLREVIEDRVSVEDLLSRKEASPLRRPDRPPFEPRVLFSDDDDQGYSILELVAPDSLGLLYRVGSRISALKCNIELVLISTEGDKAVDVFYLTHEGAKLDSDLQRRLAESISAAFE